MLLARARSKRAARAPAVLEIIVRQRELRAPLRHLAHFLGDPPSEAWAMAAHGPDTVVQALQATPAAVSASSVKSSGEQ